MHPYRSHKYLNSGLTLAGNIFGELRYVQCRSPDGERCVGAGRNSGLRYQGKPTKARCKTADHLAAVTWQFQNVRWRFSCV